MLKTVSSYINALGSLVYKGTWNANTNTPTLASGVGNAGDYYVVSVPGSTNLDGITDWQVGDWAVFNGGTWQKIDNTDQVLSVNGYQGVVVLGATDVGATPNTTYVIAGTGMSGGGRLTGNVTLTNAGVTAFNTRTGNVTLSSSDVTTALGYTPGTGNVSSVTGTSPIVSSGGNTPAISIPAANATTNGYLTSTDWSTFNSKQPGGTYVTSVSGTSPVVSSGGTTPAISMPAANATTNGYLTSSDWTTFNNKQPSGSYVTSVSGTTGRVTSTGGTTPVIDLATTAVTAASYGSASVVGTFTVDAYGRLTSAANATISIGVAQVSGAVPNTVAVTAGTGLTGGGTLTGSVTLNVAPNTTQQLVGVQNNGVAVGTRQIHNFIPGNNVTITASDDAANGRANITIATSGLGTMANQNANAVVITGGTINGVSLTLDSIDNTAIGNVTPSTGKFTDLTVTGNTVVRLTGYLYGNGSGANVTASTTIPNSGLANSTLTLGNATLTLGGTTSTVGNLTVNNVTINSGTFPANIVNVTSTTSSTATFATSSLPLVPAGYISVNLNGTVVKIPYYAV